MHINKIFLASDHGGFVAKEFCKSLVGKFECEIVDLGCFDEESVDYPDYAQKLGERITSAEHNAEIGVFGILVCGTGIGISIAANRFEAVRAALCHDATTARLAREHNNANVLAFGGRVVGRAVIEEMVATFFSTEFAGGRHTKRVGKINNK